MQNDFQNIKFLILFNYLSNLFKNIFFYVQLSINEIHCLS